MFCAYKNIEPIIVREYERGLFKSYIENNSICRCYCNILLTIIIAAFELKFWSLV